MFWQPEVLWCRPMRHQNLWCVFSKRLLSRGDTELQDGKAMGFWAMKDGYFWIMTPWKTVGETATIWCDDGCAVLNGCSLRDRLGSYGWSWAPVDYGRFFWNHLKIFGIPQNGDLNGTCARNHHSSGIQGILFLDPISFCQWYPSIFTLLRQSNMAIENFWAWRLQTGKSSN